MKRIDKSAILLLALSLFIIFEARKMGVGSFSKPGAGLFPLLSGILLLTASSVILLISIPKRISKPSEDIQGRNVSSVFYVIGTLLFFRFTLPVLGYSVTASLVLAFLIKIVGGHRWFPTMVWSIIFTGISYLLFVEWLMVQFPKGIFPF